MEHDTAAGSHRSVLKRLLRTHAAHNFNCKSHVTVHKLHHVRRIQLVPLHSQQQREHKRVERPELCAELFARLLLLPQQLLKRARQRRQTVEDAVPSVVVAGEHAEQRERRLFGLG